MCKLFVGKLLTVDYMQLTELLTQQTLLARDLVQLRACAREPCPGLKYMYVAYPLLTGEGCYFELS